MGKTYDFYYGDNEWGQANLAKFDNMHVRHHIKKLQQKALLVPLCIPHTSKISWTNVHCFCVQFNYRGGTPSKIIDGIFKRDL